MFRKILLLFFVSFIITGCKREENNKHEVEKYNRASIALNDSAVTLTRYITVPATKEDSLKIITAIELLDKSISIYSGYYLAYANKATMLLKFSDYNSSLETIQNINTKKKEYSEGRVLEGVLLNKLGMKDSASNKFNEAIDILKKKRRTSAKETAWDRINIAYITMLWKGKKEALKVFDSFTPEEWEAAKPNIDEMKKMIQNYTKEDSIIGF